MTNPLLQRIDSGIRQLFPVVVTLLLIILNALPLRLPNWSAVEPLLPLVAVYYWSLYRPDLLPASLAFGLGVVNDVVTGGAIGVSSLVFILVRAMTTSNQRFFHGKSFFVVWSGFGLVGGGAVLLQWLLVSLLFAHFPAPRPMLVELAMTLLSYPLLSWLLTRAQLVLLRGT
jgi:rod shape-determining protein MreD